MAPSIQGVKAAHFVMNKLKIGSFKVERKYAEDLVAKCYYARRKLVWEISQNGLMDKIEIEWKNISAIRAVIRQNSPGILEIEVDKVPSFYHEIEVEPKPGMRSSRTLWKESQDFTQGQASQYRRHYLEFPPGYLDQHYAKLLECDNRLLELSQKPFPSSHSAYFDSQVYQGITSYSNGHVHGSKITSASEQHHNLIAPQRIQLLRPLPLIAKTCPTLPTLGTFPPTDQSINNQMLQDKRWNFWSKCLHDDTSSAIESGSYASCIQGGGEPVFNYELPCHHNDYMMPEFYQTPAMEFGRTCVDDRRHMEDRIQDQVPADGLEQQFYASRIHDQVPVDGLQQQFYATRIQDQVLADGLEQQFYASRIQDQVPADGIQDQVPVDGLEQQFYVSRIYDQVPADGIQDQVPADGLEQQFYASRIQDQVPADGIQDQVPADGIQDQVPTDGLEQQLYASRINDQVPADGLEQQFYASRIQDQVPADGLEQQFYASRIQDQVPADGLKQQFYASTIQDQVPANGLEQQFYASDPSSLNPMDEEDQRCMFYIDELISI